jgi:hypothetical protein
VTLTGYNDSNPGGAGTTKVIQVINQLIYYVAAGNAAPHYPYTNWQTAATNIQDAIGAGTLAGRLVLVTNGVYGSGGVAIYGQMTNRVAFTGGVRVLSVNGPGVTQIVGAPAPGGTTNGDGAVRCAYGGADSVLSGFTLTNGHTRTSGDLSKEQGGGGVWCEFGGVVSNCWITGNSAGRYGGGCYQGTLNNCSLTGNYSTDEGGGAHSATLNNCSLTGNSAYNSGGGAHGTLLNRARPQARRDLSPLSLAGVPT